MLASSGGHVAEEAVVQEAPLEDEMAQRIRQVPDEEEAQRSGGVGRQGEARRAVRECDDGDGGR